MNKHEYTPELRTQLRSLLCLYHVDMHAAQYGSDYDSCPVITCRDASKLLRDSEPAPSEVADLLHEFDNLTLQPA